MAYSESMKVDFALKFPVVLVVARFCASEVVSNKCNDTAFSGQGWSKILIQNTCSVVSKLLYLVKHTTEYKEGIMLSNIGGCKVLKSPL